MKERVPKYVINPEYLKSKEFLLDKEYQKHVIAQSGECTEDYFPEDYGKDLPPDGAWIILLASVHVGKPLPNGQALHIDVPHLSIWYAMPTTTTFSRELEKGIKLPLHQAIIQTPDGEVNIWPHEYSVIKDISPYLEYTEKDGFFINFLNPDAGFDEMQLFYLRARGISLGEARRLLLPTVKSPHCCYFTFHQDYSDQLGEWYGTPYPPLPIGGVA